MLISERERTYGTADDVRAVKADEVRVMKLLRNRAPLQQATFTISAPQNIATEVPYGEPRSGRG